MTTAQQLFQARFVVEPKSIGDGELDEPLAAILRRRSHRAFRPERLPDDLLEALLVCAQSAPSKSDLQLNCDCHGLAARLAPIPSARLRANRAASVDRRSA
jgi:hypothetical protein